MIKGNSEEHVHINAPLRLPPPQKKRIGEEKQTNRKFKLKNEMISFLGLLSKCKEIGMQKKTFIKVPVTVEYASLYKE